MITLFQGDAINNRHIIVILIHIIAVAVRCWQVADIGHHNWVKGRSMMEEMEGDVECSLDGVILKVHTWVMRTVSCTIQSLRWKWEEQVEAVLIGGMKRVIRKSFLGSQGWCSGIRPP
jgi:hypothetical protein